MTESTIQELACCVCSIVQVNKQKRKKKERETVEKGQIKLTRHLVHKENETKEEEKNSVYIELARTQGHTGLFS